MAQFFKGNIMSDNFQVLEHPLLQHKLGILRRKETRPQDFRRIMNQMARILAYEATSDLGVEQQQIETPMTKTTVPHANERPIVVSIMRAGNELLDGVLSMIPFASAGHIGIYRDKFINNTVEYFFKLPKNLKNRRVLLCDPMVATGDTVLASLGRLKQYEVGEIKLLCLLISSYAKDKITSEYPDVKILTCAVEGELDEKGYLIPGMGDAGNRLYASDL